MNLFYNIMFFLQAILLAYCVKLFHNIYFKYADKRSSPILYFLPLVLQSFTALYFDLPHFLNLCTITISLFIATCYVKTLFKHRVISFLFLLAFILSTEMLVVHAMHTALDLAITSESTLPQSLLSILLMFSARILMLSIICCYKKFAKNLKIGHNFDFFYILTPILAHLMLVLLCFIVSPLLSQDENALVVWLICFTCGFLIINFLSFLTNLDLEEYRTRAILLDKEMEHYTKEHELLGTYLKDISILKHNIKHELLPILEKLPQENQEILNEFESVFDKVLTDDYKHFSNYSWLDMILNYHLNKDLTVNLHIQIDPNLEINTDPKIISIILGNLLDNALESCATTISLRIFNQNSNLFIKVENPYCGELNVLHGLLVSTKKGPNIHGFGLTSIKKIVEDNGGLFQFTLKNNCFIVEILLLN